MMTLLPDQGKGCQHICDEHALGTCAGEASHVDSACVCLHFEAFKKCSGRRPTERKTMQAPLSSICRHVSKASLIRAFSKMPGNDATLKQRYPRTRMDIRLRTKSMASRSLCGMGDKGRMFHICK